MLLMCRSKQNVYLGIRNNVYFISINFDKCYASVTLVF